MLTEICQEIGIEADYNDPNEAKKAIIGAFAKLKEEKEKKPILDKKPSNLETTRIETQIHSKRGSKLQDNLEIKLMEKEDETVQQQTYIASLERKVKAYRAEVNQLKETNSAFAKENSAMKRKIGQMRLKGNGAVDKEEGDIKAYFLKEQADLNKEVSRLKNDLASMNKASKLVSEELSVFEAYRTKSETKLKALKEKLGFKKSQNRLLTEILQVKGQEVDTIAKYYCNGKEKSKKKELMGIREQEEKLLIELQSVADEDSEESE